MARRAPQSMEGYSTITQSCMEAFMTAVVWDHVYSFADNNNTSTSIVELAVQERVAAECEYCIYMYSVKGTSKNERAGVR